ncbi:MAG: retron system putative HNH endonuclease [Chitinophagales bacterium]
MKKIDKSEPSLFTDFIKKEKPKIWADFNIGYDTRSYMLCDEQNFQCAYTEIAIEPENTSSHIDHFRKKGMFPKQCFEWQNLLTACNNEKYGAKYKDKNIKEEDYKLLIQPAIENPKSFFIYSFIGDIIPLSKDEQSNSYKKAKTSIDLFNLNHKSLKEQRKTVYKQVEAMYTFLTLKQLKEVIGRFDSFIEYVYYTLKQIDAQKK